MLKATHDSGSPGPYSITKPNATPHNPMKNDATPSFSGFAVGPEIPWKKCIGSSTLTFKVTGAARLYRAASRERSERGRPQGWAFDGRSDTATAKRTRVKVGAGDTAIERSVAVTPPRNERFWRVVHCAFGLGLAAQVITQWASWVALQMFKMCCTVPAVTMGPYGLSTVNAPKIRLRLADALRIISEMQSFFNPNCVAVQQATCSLRHHCPPSVRVRMRSCSKLYNDYAL
jgi:hypothetical protein